MLILYISWIKLYGILSTYSTNYLKTIPMSTFYRQISCYSIFKINLVKRNLVKILRQSVDIENVGQ